MSGPDPRLEPDTKADTDDGHCLHSIAISLKRIADVATGAMPPEVHHSVTDLAWHMGRAFEQGRRTDR